MHTLDSRGSSTLALHSNQLLRCSLSAVASTCTNIAIATACNVLMMLMLRVDLSIYAHNTMRNNSVALRYMAT